MRTVRSILAAALLLPCLALPACGEDERDVRAAFHEVRRTWLTEDYRGMCQHLTSAAKREIETIGHGLQRDCPSAVAERLSATILSPRDRVEPEIERVELDGDSATVVAQLGGTTPGEVRFAKEDGAWKLERMFGITAPPPEDLG